MNNEPDLPFESGASIVAVILCYLAVLYMAASTSHQRYQGVCEMGIFNW